MQHAYQAKHAAYTRPQHVVKGDADLAIFELLLKLGDLGKDGSLLLLQLLHLLLLGGHSVLQGCLNLLILLLVADGRPSLHPILDTTPGGSSSTALPWCSSAPLLLALQRA